MPSKSATELVNLMLSNNVGIECYSCLIFGEHLETHTSGIPGKAILYGHDPQRNVL